MGRSCPCTPRRPPFCPRPVIAPDILKEHSNRNPLQLLAVRRERKALLSLLFLSPILGELVSGSTPPLEFVSPLALGGFLALYGCGAVLIRDTAIRWDKGWMTILLLGAAYGVYEEGLVVKSWFDPNWIDLGNLGIYGRFAGVNFVWATLLTIYHCIVSIAIPIFLTNVLFPDLKGKRLLGDQGTLWALFFFGLVLPAFHLLVPYYGGPEHLLAVAAAAGLVYLAYRAPRGFLAPQAAVMPTRVRPFGVFGFVWMMWTFVATYFFDASGVPWPETCIVLSASALAALFALRGMLHPANAERCLFAFLAGAYGFIILFGFFYGVFNPVAGFGMVAVAPAAAIWFYGTYRQQLPRWRLAPAPLAGPKPQPAP